MSISRGLVIGIVFGGLVACSAPTFYPGEVWMDTRHHPINAHGGGILYHQGTYYWYGEYKGDSTYRAPGVGWECYRTEAGGVSCYTSKDLQNWKFRGVVLKPEWTDSTSDIHPSQVIERPKVIYNAKTGMFVMWMHIDNYNYSMATTGVAVSNRPEGPFRYLHSVRPLGEESRDMTLFKDEDGTAYQLYSSRNNSTLFIHRLTDDYLEHSDQRAAVFPDRYREAPAVFKHQQHYYLLTSGCSGWDPNAAEYAMADSMMGTWTVMGNPCQGEGSEQTFHSQSTFVLPVAGKEDCYIALFDRWNKLHLLDSRYVWLPLQFHNDSISIQWHNQWSLDDLK